jgi:hypothetical protein
MKRIALTVLIAALFVGLWFVTAPPSYTEPAGVRLLGEAPTELAQHDVGDVITAKGVTITPQLPGHDEIVPLPGTDFVLVSGRDEWIWRVDVVTKKAEKFAPTPLSPTGARIVPGRSDAVYFCMARLDDKTYDKSPGVYRLDLNTRQFTEVVTRVPLTGTMRADGLETPNAIVADHERVYPTPLKDTPLAQLNDTNARPIQFCNDLDVSKDGRHIYLTEPFSHPKASSGLGAMPEALTLARNGRVWRYDTQAKTIGLVLENNIFTDGILIEYDASGRESGLLVTETVNFRIGRAHFTGARAGQYDVLWDNLPALPDGMDRDEQGRIWVGLIKERSKLLTWVHEHPWIKPLLLRIPPSWFPPAKGTGILALSPDASQVLGYSWHDGSKVLDVSVVVPSNDSLYLPSFYKDNAGLHSVPMSAVLSKPTP